MMPPPPPAPVKASVHISAFNHGAFIAQALDSVLAQDVAFPYEIVIGDDSSTDDTAAIASSYVARFPGRVRLLAHPRNVGIYENDQRILAACRGEYVAWLESDDYWTDPRKLQRQVALLDAHPEVSACFHRARAEGVPPPTWHGAPPVVRSRYTLDHLLAEGYFIPSCTMMFRRALVAVPAGWTREATFLERTYAARLAAAGPIAYLDESLAAFRCHANSIYARASALEHLEDELATHTLIGRHLGVTDRPSWREGHARLTAQLTAQLSAQLAALTKAVP